ncbi:ABC transporter substrate-binding protein (plasmid) [Aminobacter sp. SR38]|jgi:branched-chain amino acid transport system substrate-binding protein|uniref:ABC transporter substrate-binding protein n=1 Tax=Aminobacter sp. SR38 TaxID=2774562 RepID=UPI00177BA174|nr:ABC transporter substrate-binding protein [Aminobacter sp. SR38]QOF75494.1 ABC transporter substrate-binding protein [Aminobacter sp. SR38]
MRNHLTIAALACSLAFPTAAHSEDIVVGFAIAKSGWLEAYDKPATTAAKIRIDEINKAGGLLGKQIKIVEADTKTDREQGAKAGLEVLDAGAAMMVVSCDYDLGAPAALTAESAGKNSFFLCAEDIKAGIQGVGPNSFSPSVLAAVQGATMAEWANSKRGAKSAYVLLDTAIEYNKGVCKGFDWMWAELPGTKLLGSDTFKNNDASIASQITRIKSLSEKPDVVMLCSFIPGAASAVRQLRAAGIDSLIVNGSAVDGSYWLGSVPNLSNFVVPVLASIYGDDPRQDVRNFNEKYKADAGSYPSSTYAYPGYLLIDLWAKAVERVGTTDTAAVTAELEKMRDEPTIFGNWTFSSELHQQNTGLMQIIEVNDGKPARIDEWTISKPVPLDVLLK